VAVYRGVNARKRTGLTAARSAGAARTCICRAKTAVYLGALALTLMGRAGIARAEEISILGGVNAGDDPSGGTYAWGLEYRQRLLAHLDASFGYLNEGHIPGHHRDGAMLQVWADSGPWGGRFSAALGAGPYIYFDTEQEPSSRGYRDEHGAGLILTARLSMALTRQWFALLELDQVTFTDLSTRALMLGVGYRLDSLLDKLQGGVQAGAVADVPNELNVFGGFTVINDLTSDRSSVFGLEYRFRPLPHLELSGSVLDDAAGPDGRHVGLTGEAWVVQDFLSRQVSVGLGVGPYVALSTYHTDDGRVAASVVGLASMTVSWRMSRSLALRVCWHRGFTGDDQDRDIVTAGLGWRF
jgi:hypothetical protein